MELLKKFLFVLLWIAIGFIAGAWISSFFISDTQGFGGVGTVFLSAVAGAVIGLIASLLAIENTSSKTFYYLSWFGVFVFTTLAISLAIKTSQKPDIVEPEPRVPTKPVSYKIPQQEFMAIGMASPLIEKGKIYFYNPNFEKALDEHLPYDSLTFEKTNYGTGVSYAPPWFYPEHLKLDYGFFLLKVVGITSDWIQLEVNKQTGRKAWVSRDAVEFLPWEVFLLKIFSVDPIDPQNNPVRSRPFSHASPTAVQGWTYHPLEIQNEWMRVEIYGDNLETLGEGWIQWKSGNQLLVTYNLLS